MLDSFTVFDKSPTGKSLELEQAQSSEVVSKDFYFSASILSVSCLDFRSRPGTAMLVLLNIAGLPTNVETCAEYSREHVGT